MKDNVTTVTTVPPVTTVTTTLTNVTPVNTEIVGRIDAAPPEPGPPF